MITTRTCFSNFLFITLGRNVLSKRFNSNSHVSIHTEIRANHPLSESYIYEYIPKHARKRIMQGIFIASYTHAVSHSRDSIGGPALSRFRGSMCIQKEAPTVSQGPVRRAYSCPVPASCRFPLYFIPLFAPP